MIAPPRGSLIASTQRLCLDTKSLMANELILSLSQALRWQWRHNFIKRAILAISSIDYDDITQDINNVILHSEKSLHNHNNGLITAKWTRISEIYFYALYSDWSRSKFAWQPTVTPKTIDNYGNSKSNKRFGGIVRFYEYHNHDIGEIIVSWSPQMFLS